MPFDVRVLRQTFRFLASFPWLAGKPAAELAIEAESVRKLAAELQAALGREGQAQTTYAESTKRKELIEKQLATLRPQMKRLTDARAVLEDLTKNHSLSGQWNPPSGQIPV